MKISILTYGFSGWGGGIDFIRHMLTFLDESQKSEIGISKVLILPKDNMLGFVKKIAYPYRNLLKQLLKNEKLSWIKKRVYSQRYLQKTFSDFEQTTYIYFSGASFNSQLNSAVELGSDIVFPCIDVPPDNFRLPWIGYIADFQHLYYPQYFSASEINIRNRKFYNMLHQARHIIVYGRAVAMDAERFSPGYTAKIHVLPFCPTPQKEWLTSELDVRAKYEIQSEYFLISNQFWIHKDHATAFRAFAEYRKQGGNAVLICTGEISDYRFPQYFDELLDLLRNLGIYNVVKILGHIPKADQISLLKNSLAVIQTTLFEGGPGGGASYDAVSLGVPVIASSIPINLEMNCGDITFFEAGNHRELSRAMVASNFNKAEKKTNDELIAEGFERKLIIANSLLTIIKQASDR
jgi:glycosyltransferase involved in cell wall biosynthesis